MYEFSGTPGPQNESNVSALIQFCIDAYCIMHNDRNALMQEHCVPTDDIFGDQGSQKIRTGTHRFGTSCHPGAHRSHSSSHAKAIALSIDCYLEHKQKHGVPAKEHILKFGDQ